MAVRNILPSSKVVKKPLKYEYSFFPVTLGEHIRKKRIEDGLLQRDVAAIIGVIEQSITNWENGRSQPQLQNYPAIIEFLNDYPFDHAIDTIEGKIKQIRYCKGYSFDVFGAVLGVHGTTVNAWEHGEHAPSAYYKALIKRMWFDLPYIKKYPIHEAYERNDTV